MLSHLAHEFFINSALKLIREILGYEDNMSKLSWFPPGQIERADIEDEDE